MNVKVRKIEVDEETAVLLEARASARGMSVTELLADIACNEEVLPPDMAAVRARGEGPWSAEALEEDARRLAEFERTRMGVPWDEVKTWMQSWGRPNELPPPSRANCEPRCLGGSSGSTPRETHAASDPPSAPRPCRVFPRVG
jgi:hypothetical protein